MKTTHYWLYIASCYFLLCLSACHDVEDYGGEIQDGKLALNYQVDSGMQGTTYALAAETHECRIDDVYTLFFRASSHSTNPNAYVGYTRTGVTASSSTGSARVTLPPGEDVDDEWQLIFLANFDVNAYLDGESSVDDLLTNQVASQSYNTARQYLMAYFDRDTGLSAPLAMSASLTKAASTDVASITFKRRVARIDVSSSAGNFIFETVQVWNARTRAYLLDEGGSFVSGTSAGDFRNYDAQVVNAASNVALAKLYAFPNAVLAPTMRDHETTCLIIGGKYNGSPTTTYYRVNVCPPTGQQSLKANGAYTVNITNVTAAGETDPGDAYDKSRLSMDYILDEWDDSFLGTYVFDKDGNGLAVSQREVIFSDKGSQTVQLEVFTIPSATNPISGSWAVGIQGTDAASFSSQKVTNSYLTASVLTDNTNAADRKAEALVTWGSISLPIGLTQLNPTSQISGIKVMPHRLWSPLTGTIKEVCVNLQGNFSGATRADLATNIIYKGTNSGWLTLSPGSTPDNPSAGLFYYTVTALPLASNVREANISFIMKQGSLVAAAQISISQTEVDASIRQFTMNLLERSGANYIDRGNTVDFYTTIKGFPTGQNKGNHLHFAIVEHEQIKYRLNIHSAMGWKIVTSELSGRINFSKLNDPGDAHTTKVVDIEAAASPPRGWDGTFYLEYDNGDREEFIVHQHGVLKTLGEYKLPGNNTGNKVDNSVYYYGTFRLNGKLWLDRNIGATVGQNDIDGYYTNQTSTGIISIADAKGAYFTDRQASYVCPAGFRLPKCTAGSGEWDWVSEQMVWSTATGNAASGGVPYSKVWYITLTSSPDQKWYLPICGYSYADTQKDLTAYYWGSGINQAVFDSEYGYRYLWINQPSGTTYGLQVRCIQD